MLMTRETHGDEIIQTVVPFGIVVMDFKVVNLSLVAL